MAGLRAHVIIKHNWLQFTLFPTKMADIAKMAVMAKRRMPALDKFREAKEAHDAETRTSAKQQAEERARATEERAHAAEPRAHELDQLVFQLRGKRVALENEMKFKEFCYRCNRY